MYYVCMYACMHACTYVCMYVCNDVYVCMYVRVYVRMYVCMCVCMYVCICVCLTYVRTLQLREKLLPAHGVSLRVSIILPVYRDFFLYSIKHFILTTETTSISHEVEIVEIRFV